MRSCELCGREYDADSTAEKCADVKCEGNILPPPKKSGHCLICQGSPGWVTVLDVPANPKAGTPAAYKKQRCPNPACAKVGR